MPCFPTPSALPQVRICNAIRIHEFTEGSIWDISNVRDPYRWQYCTSLSAMIGPLTLLRYLTEKNGRMDTANATIGNPEDTHHDPSDSIQNLSIYHLPPHPYPHISFYNTTAITTPTAPKTTAVTSNLPPALFFASCTTQASPSWRFAPVIALHLMICH